MGAGALLAGALAVGRLVGPTPAPPARPLARAVALPPRPAPRPALADSVVALGLRLLGTNYCYAGTTPATGFDCSGFVMYCFERYGIKVPHGSDNQMHTGRAVPRAEARPGDIVIFTGTDPKRRSPGHAGIVVSQPGEPLRFVHSSSTRKNPGVRISQVNSTRYEERFLGVRRVVE